MGKRFKAVVALMMSLALVVPTTVSAAAANKVDVTVSSGTGSASFTVNSDYEANFVAAKGKTVTPSKVDVKVSVTDVAALGISGTKSHNWTVGTESSAADELPLDSALNALDTFSGSGVTVKVEDKSFVYEVKKATTDANWALNAKTDKAAASEAWQKFASYVETGSATGSEANIVAGAYVQVGTEKLLFESNAKLDDANALKALEKEIRNNAKLVNGNGGIVIYLPAGTDLSVDASKATLKNNATITVTGLSELEGESYLAAIKACNTVDDYMKAVVRMFNHAVVAANGAVTVDIQFEDTVSPEPIPEADNKVEINVSSETSKGTGTAQFAVNDKYVASFTAGKGQFVSPSNATVELVMKDIASLGISGVKSHTLTVGTESSNYTELPLDSALNAFDTFEKAVVNGTVRVEEKNTKTDEVKEIVNKGFAYDVDNTSEEENNWSLVATPTDEEAVRAAWQEITNHVTTGTGDGDSKANLLAGTYVQIGSEKLLFENDAVLNDANALKALEKEIRDNAKLVDGDGGMVIYLPAESMLTVDDSNIMLNDNTTITVKGLEELEEKGYLAALKACDTVDKYMQTVMAIFNDAVAYANGEVSVDIVFEHEVTPEDPVDPEDPVNPPVGPEDPEDPVNPPAGGDDDGDGKVDNVPDTGDNSPVAMYALLMVAAFVVILKRKSIFAR